MIKEVAVENFTDIPQKIAAGANRIELCDNLAVGGTTVSRGVMAETRQYTNDHSIPVVTMIRPRGGNYVYSDTELKIMETDIFQAQELGMDGIVIGALTTDNKIDHEAMEQLIAAAGGMQITFHMAFDDIEANYQSEELNWLIDQGIDRVLTHGGPLTEPIAKTISNIAKTIKTADNRIIVLPGGGITKENYQAIAERLNVSEVHGTKIV